MKSRLVVAVVLAAVALASPVKAQESSEDTILTGDDRLNATLWSMTSAEFEASSRMAFYTARLALDAALADTSRTAALEQAGDFANLPPAIIVDVDETILDNGPFQVRLMYETKLRPAELMSKWVEEADAKPLPGAAEFLSYAQSKGVTVFYVTNRNAEKEIATRKNLAAIGAVFPVDVDTVLLENEKPEWKGDKSSRRAYVAQSHRVVMLIGDDFNDFVSGRTSLTDRRQKAEAYRNKWGRDWIMIPNPMYGSWEGATFDFKFRASPEERRRMKHELLKSLDP